MKRFLLIAALLVSCAVSAHADTDIWTSNPPRSDAEMAAANNVCNEQFGPPQKYTPTSRAYKNCMARQGWKFVKTQHDDTWINHRGMSCHPILNGMGSECSSF